MSACCWRRFEELVSLHPCRPAIVSAAGALTFIELHREALARAANLALASGDRVVVSGANGPAIASAVLAVWRAGAIPVLMHPEAPSRHVEHAVHLAAPTLALLDADGVAGAVGPTPVHALAVEADSIAAPEAAHQLPDAPASILFTSGSTGLPKGVTQSAANLISGARRVAGYLNYREDDSILCAIPFAFDYGWGQLLSTLLQGVTLVLPDQQNAFGICEAIAAHRPTVIAGVPSMMGDLLSGLSPIRKIDTSPIRLITNTGSKIPPSLFTAIREAFPNAAVSLNYGLTETYRSASLPVEMADAFPTSVGFAIPGVDLAVVRPDGSRARPGEEGEIVHRGEGVFLGYWGEPERTSEVLRPDPLWPHREIAAPRVVFTGDLGHMDEAGRLQIHGRRDGQMKCMGVRVSRDEVELLLHETDLVLEAAVVARPHDVLGDLIVACVVPKVTGDTGLRELKKAMRELTNRFMQPREYRLLDSIPRNTNGKVDYPALRALVSEAS